MNFRHIVISGPSGSGKTTLANLLCSNYPKYSRFITTTTRKRRHDETNGKDYFFITREEFENGIKNGEFIEYEDYSGNLYGTRKKHLNEKPMVIVIGPDGVKSFKKINIDCLFVFIYEEKEVILSRLLKRSKNDLDDPLRFSQSRLKNYDSEMELYKNGLYDIGIKCSNLEETYANLVNFLKKAGTLD